MTRAINKRILLLLAAGGAGAGLALYRGIPDAHGPASGPLRLLTYQPRTPLDTGGFIFTGMGLKPWKDPTSLDDIRAAYSQAGYRNVERIDQALAGRLNPEDVIKHLIVKTSLYLYEGDADKAYRTLQDARRKVEASEILRKRLLYTVVFFQGVVGLRRAENENCIACRGARSCILPIHPSAVHAYPVGARLAVTHFTEYLEQFPDDLAVRWLLNLAYMTLGEHPGQVPARDVLSLNRFGNDLDIGRFRDISHAVGIERLNMAGGAIMDDFDNDGLLDVVVSTWDASQGMALYRNRGDGTFEDRGKSAGIDKQYAGFNLVQADYNNDGFLDIFVSRGGWLPIPMRSSLLRNNGDGTFADVTAASGLLQPVNSIAAGWADYDNDGFLDLLVCCDQGPNRLYRNHGDGTFEEVAARAGVAGKEKKCKGCAWIDFDNDGYADLFVTYFESTPQLFHNRRDGTFTDVTEAMGITGPRTGFSCWAFDFDNDGWLDILATCYERTLDDLVGDLLGRPPGKGNDVTRLYRNLGGKGFQDVSKEAGVARVFGTMGSNFADFDNDGYLDIYLGTGDPLLETLIPNRMLKNVAGKRFADITTTSGTGHLQKGHGVACGDWDRDGNVDLFVELGGASPGDRYHNVLFQNPGHDNNWLTVKLIGKKTNRAAIGARIKAVTTGPCPLTVYRHVSSGSSFGANPLQQTIGLGKASSLATLEITWPGSGTTQLFHDVAVNQAVEITELAKEYRKLDWQRVPLTAARSSGLPTGRR